MNLPYLFIRYDGYTTLEVWGAGYIEQLHSDAIHAPEHETIMWPLFESIRCPHGLHGLSKKMLVIYIQSRHL
jgi:hypothetical protein